MEFKDGRIQGFELKFRSVAEDTEQYLFALADLLEAGKIQEVPGQSLYSSHYDEGYAWIIESYFEKGLLDDLEAYFTPSGEVFFAPMHETQLKYLGRMLDMGESARVRRIWRAHLGLMKPHYWFFVSERNKGFKYNQDLSWDTEKGQRANYEKLAARVPELKRTLLDVMADYRALLVRTGATEAELARVDAEIAAIEAEERPKPKGKKDDRPMTEDLFWELINQGLGDHSLGERLETLPDRLALFKPAAIRKFDQILREKDNVAYRTDIWALAYLLRGGCSDDSFDAFRGWLILQGRKVFEATIVAPDDFDVARYHGDSGGMDALRDAAPMAYELREGKAMKPVKGPLLELKGPELEEEDFAAYLPKIAAAVNAAD
jgi:hypothetical protein